jgi:hypothetical protein
MSVQSEFLLSKWEWRRARGCDPYYRSSQNLDLKFAWEEAVSVGQLCVAQNFTHQASPSNHHLFPEKNQPAQMKTSVQSRFYVVSVLT